VGATNWFIRVPFMIEGFIQGLVGSLLAVASLQVLNRIFTERLNQRGIELLSSFAVANGDVTTISIALLIGGTVIGMVFSAVAASLYLDV
ncbi:MAG: FtsX-like permease family protein, partial [Acidimicrobiales bacterium]